MDSNSSSASRRSEDIALDLLKFVATHANIGSKAVSTPGFGAPAGNKPEDQVNQVLELYARCREAVEAPLQAGAAAGAKK